MPEFTDLPAMLQVIATMAVIVFGGGIAFFGFTKKWLDHLSPHERPTKDTVVVSGAFADGKPINDLAHAIRILIEHAEQNAVILDGHRRVVSQNTDELVRSIDSNARLGQRIERLTEAVNRMTPP